MKTKHPSSLRELLQTVNEHEGWSNKPTWAVNLWLSNDEGLYHTTQQLVKHTAKDKLPDVLKTWVETECCPHSESPNLEGDLLTWALAYVNWEEIAEAWLEE